MAKPQVAKILDEAKLMGLSPPFSLYVVKSYGKRITPINLPPKGNEAGMAAGTGYDVDDVKSISGLIARIAGGGDYNVAVTDTRGERIEFTIWLDVKIFPDLTPQEMAYQAPAAPAPVIPIGGGGGGDATAGGTPSWFNQVPPGVARQVPPPSPYGYGAPPMPPAPNPYGYGAQPSPSPYGYGAPPAPSPYGQPPGWGPQWGEGRDLDRGRDRDRERERDRDQREQRERERERDRAELQRLREESLKRDADRERERIQQAHERDIAALREDIRRASEPKGGGAEVSLLKDALDQLRQENKDLRDEMRQSQRDGGKSSDMSAIMNMIVQMMSQSTAQFNQLIPLLLDKDKGGDKGVELVIESMKQSQESMRRIFDAVNEQARDRERVAAASAMTPKDMLDISQKLVAMSGSDQQMKMISETIIPMVRNVLQLQKENQAPGESPLAGLLGEAIQKAGDVAEKIVSGRRDVAVSEARVREVETVAAAQAQRVANAPVVQHAAPVAPAQDPAAGEVDDLASASGADAETVRRFGHMAESVARLRAAVKAGQVQPGAVYGGVSQARGLVQTKGWKVPALALLESEQVAEFVDQLVPEAAQDWKRELMRWFHAKGDPGPSSMSAPAVAPPVAVVAPAAPQPVAAQVIDLAPARAAAKAKEEEGDEIPDGTPCTCGHVVEDHEEEDPGSCDVAGCACEAFAEVEGPAAS